MRQRPNPSPLRARVAALVSVAAFAVAGCTGAVEEPAATESGPDAILASREALGDPLLALAEAVITLADGIDAARHELPRGADMQAQVTRLPGLQRAVRVAAENAVEAAGQAPVESAATLVERAAERALQGAAAADGEIAFLRRLATIDVALFAAAAEWDRPGSQSEIRARLDSVAGEVSGLRRMLVRSRPAPARCAAMKRNRGEWISTVRSRTVELQTHAHSAGGATFDRLRSAYRPLPLAVEPRTADKADRPCWQEHSQVVRAARSLRQAVDDLRAALSP